MVVWMCWINKREPYCRLSRQGSCETIQWWLMTGSIYSRRGSLAQVEPDIQAEGRILEGQASYVRGHASCQPPAGWMEGGAEMGIRKVRNYFVVVIFRGPARNQHHAAYISRLNLSRLNLTVGAAQVANRCQFWAWIHIHIRAYMHT